MKTVIIIPARMQSKRFPNKPLALINGVPMIQRVWEQAMKYNLADTFVACAEKEIFDLITSIGGNAIMTDPKLPSGTDRIYAALKQIDNYKSYLIEDYKSKNPDSFDEKKMEDEFNQTANKNIKWLLIREFLMNKEKVSLESKEVEDKIQEMIQQSPEYKKDIIKFYNDDTNKNKLKEDVLNNKFFSKLENFFINKHKAVPTDKIKKH